MERKLKVFLALVLITILGYIWFWLVWVFPIITGIILCILVIPWFIAFTIYPITKSIIENKKRKKLRL